VQATMTRRLCAFNETTSLFMAAVNCSDCAVGGGGLTTNCALFDFLLYTLVGGTLCAFGLVGNVLSFIVLYFGGDHSSKTAATIFLLRALAVADSLVLVTSLPLWVLEPVNVYTGHLGACHRFYMVAMPYLWPLYLMSLTATIMLTVLVSFHRYTAVCMPYHSVTLSSLSRCRRHVAYVAAAAILYNVPRFFEYRRVDVFCQTAAGQRSFITSTLPAPRYNLLTCSLHHVHPPLHRRRRGPHLPRSSVPKTTRSAWRKTRNYLLRVGSKLGFWIAVRVAVNDSAGPAVPPGRRAFRTKLRNQLRKKVASVFYSPCRAGPKPGLGRSMSRSIFRVLYDNICYFVVMLGGPLVLLAFLNAKLIMALKEKMRKRREMRGVATTTVSGHNQQQQQQDLTVTLVVVVPVVDHERKISAE